MELERFTEKDIDEFIPSKWTKRFSGNDEKLWKNHINCGCKFTLQNKEKYQCHANIPYGLTKMESMDIYFKNAACDDAIVVYVHGGYWQLLNKDVSAYCVGPLVENGIRAIILDYALCPEVTIEEIICQMVKATRTIFAYAQQTCAKSITFCGHSAGAHLIACMLQDKSILTIPNIHLLSSVFLISGVYDLCKLRYINAVNPNNILSLNINNTPKISPNHLDYEHLRCFQNLKFFIYAAEYDSETFKQQSKDFHNYLQNFGLESKYKIVPKVDHFDIVENLVCPHLSEISKQMIEELKQYSNRSGLKDKCYFHTQ